MSLVNILMFAFDRGLFDDYDDPDTIRRLLPIAQPVTVTGEALAVRGAEIIADARG